MSLRLLPVPRVICLLIFIDLLLSGCFEYQTFEFSSFLCPGYLSPLVFRLLRFSVRPLQWITFSCLICVLICVPTCLSAASPLSDCFGTQDFHCLSCVSVLLLVPLGCFGSDAFYCFASLWMLCDRRLSFLLVCVTCPHLSL